MNVNCTKPELSYIPSNESRLSKVKCDRAEINVIIHGGKIKMYSPLFRGRRIRPVLLCAFQLFVLTKYQIDGRAICGMTHPREINSGFQSVVLATPSTLQPARVVFDRNDFIHGNYLIICDDGSSDRPYNMSENYNYYTLPVYQCIHAFIDQSYSDRESNIYIPPIEKY
jgi:hypothetical protein